MSLDYNDVKGNIEKAVLSFEIVDDDGNRVPKTIELGDGEKGITYNGAKYSGMELLVKLLLDHIEENIDTSLLKRFENLLKRFNKLETDFDNFVVAMGGAGVGPATAVPATVAGFLLKSNTVSRGIDKGVGEAISTSEDKPYIYGNK